MEAIRLQSGGLRSVVAVICLYGTFRQRQRWRRFVARGRADLPKLDSLFEVVVSDAHRGGENIPRLPRFGAIGTIPAGAPSATLHRRLPLPFERPFHILEFLSRNRRILWSRLDTERLFHQPFAHPRRGSYHSDARSSRG